MRADMRALIINIDHNYRSVYTGSIAACLMKKIPSLKITGFMAAENKLLTTTGLFEKIHFFDTKDFFKDTRNLTSAEVEAEIIKAVTPLKSVKWDVIINLSSNLLGSLLTNFLTYKEIKGTFLDNSLKNLKFTDLSSYLLTTVPDDYNNFFHFTYLYRNMLRRFEEVTLTSIWKKGVEQEFLDYFLAIKASEKKSHIVLIDANLYKHRSEGELDFVAGLFRKLHAEKDYLPILIGHEISKTDPLIKRLTEVLQGEVYCLSSENEAQLSIMSIASVLITDDLYLKAIADLSLKPSIFIGKTVNVSDFSIVPGSFQLIRNDMNQLDDQVVSLVKNILEDQPLKLDQFPATALYETFIHENLPLLEPVCNSSEEFSKWWLALKFIASLQDFKTPFLKVNTKHYLSAITKERSLLQSGGAKGLFSIAQELSKAQILTGSVLKEAEVLTKVEKFLATEERL